MPGENVSSVEEARAKAQEESEGRKRSAIGFPYDDLKSAVELAQAIHNNVGSGECADDQLSAWTNQSPKSSGYRMQIAAARMFGLIDSAVAGRYRLSQLGRLVVDPKRDREARAQAFLRVPLYNAVFEKYRGGVIPPAAALERDMEGLGVAGKVKDRARRVFERSAQQAGFFEQGRNRLVMPGIAERGEDGGTPPKDEEQRKNGGNAGGGGSNTPGMHPFIQGLLRTLPDPDADWPLAQRVKWLQTAANIFDLIYKGDGGIEVRPAPAQRSPRPGE